MRKPEMTKYWKAEIHLHAGRDAPFNTSDAVAGKIKMLADQNRINTAWILDHDQFVKESFIDRIGHLPIQLLPGIEVSAFISKNRFAHVLGLFDHVPRYWPFKNPYWSGSLRQIFQTINRLPPISEVIQVILENDGIPVLAHPSRFVPWACIKPHEITKLSSQIDIKSTVFELNGSFIFIWEHKIFKALGSNLGVSFLGGSDAHDPQEIGRKVNKYPRLSDNSFQDLKVALHNNAVKINRSNQGFVDCVKLLIQRYISDFPNDRKANTLDKDFAIINNGI